MVPKTPPRADEDIVDLTQEDDQQDGRDPDTVKQEKKEKIEEASWFSASSFSEESVEALENLGEDNNVKQEKPRADEMVVSEEVGFEHVASVENRIDSSHSTNLSCQTGHQTEPGVVEISDTKVPITAMSKRNMQLEDANLSHPDILHNLSNVCPAAERQDTPAVDPVIQFHKDVTKHISACLNGYYFINVSPDYQRKIASKEDYVRLNKNFSHKFRQELKESFLELENDINEIRLNNDMMLYMQNQIDMEMEKLPTLD